MTSTVAQAAGVCKSNYSNSSGDVADSVYYTSLCGTDSRRIPNAFNIRQVKSNGDRVCHKAVPLPSGYVVTSQSYDSNCGQDSLWRPNTGTLYKAYDGIRVCMGYTIPAGYRIKRTYYDGGSCGLNQFLASNTAVLELSSSGSSSSSSSGTTSGTGTSSGSSSGSAPSGGSTIPPSASVAPPSAQTGITLSGNYWFQIQVSSNHAEVYQGPARFVSLSKGTYDVINLTNGQRRNGVVVR